jgi:hypothetical protein
MRTGHSIPSWFSHVLCFKKYSELLFALQSRKTACHADFAPLKRPKELVATDAILRTGTVT